MIVFNSVSKSFKRNKVLDDVSLEIGLGERVALIGSNGAGKTTLVNLIPRFYDPTAGSVKIDGHDIRQVKMRSLRGKEPFKPSPMPAFYAQVATSFGGIARDGGGDLVRLDEDKVLIRQVLELTFGARWKVEMAPYLKELS